MLNKCTINKFDHKLCTTVDEHNQRYLQQKKDTDATDKDRYETKYRDLKGMVIDVTINWIQFFIVFVKHTRKTTSLYFFCNYTQCIRCLLIPLNKIKNWNDSESKPWTKWIYLHELMLISNNCISQHIPYLFHYPWLTNKTTQRACDAIQKQQYRRLAYHG